ncbi:EAL domain-containing protein [Herbaspirillum sp. HC18]|nr:EAL domain-containing protein [Herbaspirillum sp. HC18]
MSTMQCDAGQQKAQGSEARSELPPGEHLLAEEGARHPAASEPPMPASAIPPSPGRRSKDPLLTPVAIHLTLLFVIVIGVIWAGVCYQLDYVRDQIVKSSERDRSNLARAFAEQVTASIKGIDLSLLSLREQWRHDQADFHDAVLRQQNYFVRDVSFQIGIISGEGMLVYTSLDPAARPVSLADREHFRVHAERRSDDLFISKPVFGRVSNRWSIQFTRPIFDAKQRFLGVVVLSVDPEYFSRFYDTINLGERSAVTLVKTSGDILSRSPDTLQALGKSLAGRPFLAQGAPATGSYRARGQTDDVERIYTWRRLDDFGVIVVIGEAVDSLFAPYYQQRRNFLIGGTVATIVIAFFAFLIAYGLRQRAKVNEALRASQDRWKFALEGAGDAVWQWDLKNGTITFSKRLQEMLGNGETELGGRFDDWMNRICPEDRERVQADIQAYLDGRTPAFVTEHRALHKDGSWRWLLARGMAVSRDKHGKPLCLVGTQSHITDRKRADEQLRIAAAAFEVQEGMMVTDAAGTILRVNRAFEEITGYAAAEAVGRTPSILRSGRQDQEFYRQMWQGIAQNGYWQGEIWNRRKTGEIYPEWLVITTVKDAAGNITHYVAAFSDITLRKNTEAQIRNLAFYDPLTSLPNRRLLMDRAAQALAAGARSRRFGAIMLLDLDHFKTLNDTWGHDMGDELLIQVARRLVSCVRERDTVARLGGDEFVVLLEELSQDEATAAAQAEAVAEKILRTLNEPYVLRGFPAGGYHNTPSIGISYFCGHAEPVDVLLKHADIALYQAKDEGRNTIRFYNAAMQASLNEKSALEAGLREALASGGFSLYYQPVIDERHRIGSVEALLRWNAPGKGMLLPSEFIPVAEETGLILQIGQWVLEQGCAQLAAWSRTSGMENMVLGINLSARQFRQPDFAGIVRRALEAAGANPARLKFELTESMVLDDIDDAIRKMEELRKLGVRFAIDDFGTGYASLIYLKRLPVDQLKIDQSFIHGIGTGTGDATIVRTIIEMSRSLQMEVVAEGVELAEQHAFLKENDCTLFQGFLFGKPMPLEEFESMFAAENK